MQLLRAIIAHTNVFRAGVTRGLTTIIYDGKARQAAHLVDRWQQTVAKGLAASCGEDYEHIAPAYQIQYYFLLLVQISE